MPPCEVARTPEKNKSIAAIVPARPTPKHDVCWVKQEKLKQRLSFLLLLQCSMRAQKTLRAGEIVRFAPSFMRKSGLVDRRKMGLARCGRDPLRCATHGRAGCSCSVYVQVAAWKVPQPPQYSSTLLPVRQSPEPICQGETRSSRGSPGHEAINLMVLPVARKKRCMR